MVCLLPTPQRPHHSTVMRPRSSRPICSRLWTEKKVARPNLPILMHKLSQRLSFHDILGDSVQEMVSNTKLFGRSEIMLFNLRIDSPRVLLSRSHCCNYRIIPRIIHNIYLHSSIYPVVLLAVLLFFCIDLLDSGFVVLSEEPAVLQLQDVA